MPKGRILAQKPNIATLFNLHQLLWLHYFSYYSGCLPILHGTLAMTHHSTHLRRKYSRLMWLDTGQILLNMGTYTILSHASEAGSPTNRSGSDKTRGQGSFGPSTGGPTAYLIRLFYYDRVSLARHNINDIPSNTSKWKTKCVHRQDWK